MTGTEKMFYENQQSSREHCLSEEVDKEFERERNKLSLKEKWRERNSSFWKALSLMKRQSK